MQEEVLYTPEELANKLKLSKYTIYEMIKRGDISAHHIGRSIRVSQTQLDLYLMNTGKAENVFDGEIITEGNLKFAVTNGVKISISTELEGQVKIAIRSEDIIIGKEAFKSSARNVHKGVVEDVEVDDISVKVLLNIGIPLRILITKASMIEMDIKKGDEFYAIFKAMSVVVLK